MHFAITAGAMGILLLLGEETPSEKNKESSLSLVRCVSIPSPHIDPTPVPVSPKLTESVHESAPHIHNSHAEIKSHINVYDEKYKFAADSHCESKGCG